MKNSKVKIEVLKIRNSWCVQFTIGVQTFALEYGGTKAEANWMAGMLKTAFKSLLTPNTQ